MNTARNLSNQDRDYVPSWRLKNLDTPPETNLNHGVIFQMPGARRWLLVKGFFSFLIWSIVAYSVELGFLLKGAAWTSRYPWKLAWPFPAIVAGTVLLYNFVTTYRWEWKLLLAAQGREIIVDDRYLQMATRLSQWTEKYLFPGVFRKRRFHAADTPYISFEWANIERFEVGHTEGYRGFPIYRIKVRGVEDDYIFERMIPSREEIKFLDMVSQKIAKPVVLDAGTTVLSDSRR